MVQETLHTVHVDPNTLNNLYNKNAVKISDVNSNYPILSSEILYPNAQLILKHESQSALAVIDPACNFIELCFSNNAPFGISPRNTEQTVLMHQLQNDDIKLQIIAGKAGCGKSLLAMASGLSKVLEDNLYKRLVITKPTYQVGEKGAFAAVPGNIQEKYEPYLMNFMMTLEELGMERAYLNIIKEKRLIEFVPLQLMRGMSFKNCMVVADEVQSLSRHEMQTLCSRIGANSKLVLLGDPRQIDRSISFNETGLARLIKSDRIKYSDLCAMTHLTKNERSRLSTLLDDVLLED